jgi:hypothetical protein
MEPRRHSKNSGSVATAWSEAWIPEQELHAPRLEGALSCESPGRPSGVRRLAVSGSLARALPWSGWLTRHWSCPAATARPARASSGRPPAGLEAGFRDDLPAAGRPGLVHSRAAGSSMPVR